LNVIHKIPDVRAAIQQFVQADHDSFAVVVSSVCFEGGVPLLRGDLKLFIYFAKLFLKTLPSGFQS